MKIRRNNTDYYLYKKTQERKKSYIDLIYHFKEIGGSDTIKMTCQEFREGLGKDHREIL